MRRLLIAILLSLFALAVLGCSGGTNTPVTPSDNSLPQDNQNGNEMNVLYEGSFEIDMDTLTITQDRKSDTIYDITGFLPDKCPGGCFRFQIVGIVGTVLEIQLTIENPLTVQVYDVRLMYKNLFGKTVLNPDSYTDFQGAPVSNIYPFTAFATDVPDRAFPVGPGGIDNQTLFLDFPAGSQAAVNYAITASLPLNAGEPYEISEMSQSGSLTPTGGSSVISCKVDDHQDNVSAVYLDASPFTGGPVQMLPDPTSPGYFEATISNTSGAPEGTYNQLIMAMSPNGQNISTYNYIEIVVSQGSRDLVACFTYDPEVVRMEVDPTYDFNGSCSVDNGGYDIVQYEWDFDWDGNPANFTVDDNTTTAFTSNTYDAPGTYKVGLRVTNNNTPPETSDIYSEDVIVRGWLLPPIRLTTEDVGYTDMWWSVDRRVGVTSDGIAHVIAANYYPENDISDRNKLEYYKCDQNGIISQTEIAVTYINDVEIYVDDSDAIYAFYMKGNGDIAYRLNSGGGFSPEVFAMTREDGKTADTAGYTVNANGDIMVMMSEYGGEDPTQFPPNPAVISWAVDTGSGFSAKTTLATPDRWISYTPPGSGSGYGITVCAKADLDGTFYLSWDGLPAYGNSNRQIWFASYDGSMSATGDIAVSSQPEFFPQFRVDPDNNLWCGYRTDTVDMIAIKPNGSTTFDSGFTAAEAPAHNWSFDINPSNGEIMHMFDQRDYAIGDQYHVWFKIYNATDSSTDIFYTNSYRVDTSVDTRSWWPNVAHSPDGHWYAVWDDQRDLPAPQALGNIYFAMYY